MFSFRLEIGGVISIDSKRGEELGFIEMPGVGAALQKEISTSVGLHECLAVQTINDNKKVAVPNDIRFVLDEIGMSYAERRR